MPADHGSRDEPAPLPRQETVAGGLAVVDVNQPPSSAPKKRKRDAAYMAAAAKAARLRKKARAQAQAEAARDALAQAQAQVQQVAQEQPQVQAQMQAQMQAHAAALVLSTGATYEFSTGITAHACKDQRGLVCRASGKGISRRLGIYSSATVGPELFAAREPLLQVWSCVRRSPPGVTAVPWHKNNTSSCSWECCHSEQASL